MGKVLFVAGIDTDAGKSYATGWLANKLMGEGFSVITQKFIQTGCDEWSEDIDVHREIMGIDYQDVDRDHTTAPMVFSYPCSAQLAAKIDGRELDVRVIKAASDRLSSKYDYVLVEGAGGLMVPISDEYLTIDYIKEQSLPVALVTNARLGSISHTVLALEAIRNRKIELDCVLFNTYFDGADRIIARDTREWIGRYVKRNFRGVPVFDVPTLGAGSKTGFK